MRGLRNTSGSSSKASVADLYRLVSHDRKRSRKDGRRWHRQRRSRRPFAHSATRSSSSSRRPWTLVADGTRISDEFLLVEILNIRSIGPNLVFGPDASPSDGYFDVVMAQECHRQELLTYLERRAAGEATRLALPCHRARDVIIERCVEVHVDDERVDTCELGQISIRIEPSAIAVLV